MKNDSKHQSRKLSLRHYYKLVLIIFCASLAHPAQAIEEDAYRKAYLRVDFLAAQGYGLIQDKYAPPDNSKQRYTSSPNDRAEFDAEIQQKNAESVAKLNSSIQEIKQQCGANFSQRAQVGMSEQNLRQCCLQLRFGELTQYLKTTVDDQEVHLYILGYKKTTRIYVVNQQVTAIREIK